MKHNVVSHSCAKSEYKAMAKMTHKLVWIQLLTQLDFRDLAPMSLWCNYKTTMHIAYILVFRERKKK